MGIVGLDYPAVFKIAEILDIEINICLFSKIKALEGSMLKKWSNKGGGSKAEKSWASKAN